MAKLESRWQANERRLNELHAMTPPEREANGEEIDWLEAKQDEIEFQLSFELLPPPNLPDDRPELCGFWTAME